MSASDLLARHALVFPLSFPATQAIFPVAYVAFSIEVPSLALVKYFAKLQQQNK